MFPTCPLIGCLIAHRFPGQYWLEDRSMNQPKHIKALITGLARVGLVRLPFCDAQVVQFGG